MGRLTSLVLGALVFPALSAAAGSALFWLAQRRGNSAPLRALRAVLGVGAVLAARSGSGPAPAGAGAGTSWIAQLARAPAALRSPRTAAAAAVDPKWLRSTLGAALVLVVRDACELAAGVLEQRRRRSRRVVERPFRPGMGAGARAGAGAVQREGEAAAQAQAVSSSSGGRNAQGREAVVHTLL